MVEHHDCRAERKQLGAGRGLCGYEFAVAGETLRGTLVVAGQH